MSRNFQPQRLNLQALAQDGQPWSEVTPLNDLQRLADEAQDLGPEAVVAWQVRAELRPQSGAEDQVWLHLSAHTTVP